MYSDKCDLRGKRGIERLERVGPYSVIANKVLHQEGRSSRYAVVNEREAWVDSVHASPDHAVRVAEHLVQS